MIFEGSPAQIDNRTIAGPLLTAWLYFMMTNRMCLYSDGVALTRCHGRRSMAAQKSATDFHSPISQHMVVEAVGSLLMSGVKRCFRIQVLGSLPCHSSFLSRGFDGERRSDKKHHVDITLRVTAERLTSCADEANQESFTVKVPLGYSPSVTTWISRTSFEISPDLLGATVSRRFDAALVIEGRRQRYHTVCTSDTAVVVRVLIVPDHQSRRS